MLFSICIVLVSVITRNLSQTDRAHLVVGLLAKKRISRCQKLHLKRIAMGEMTLRVTDGVTVSKNCAIR